MGYGYGTHSHINSTEYRQTKRDRALYTKLYEAGEIKFEPVQIPVLCRCPQRPYPHELQTHATLGSDWAHFSGDSPRQSWPWSLTSLPRDASAGRF